jgi:hypothetical protein
MKKPKTTETPVKVFKISEEYRDKLLACAVPRYPYTDKGFAIVVTDNDGRCHVVNSIASHRFIVVNDAYSYVIKFVKDDLSLIDVEIR